MIYRQFQDLKLSGLGFGTMRLPLIPSGSESDIDQNTVDSMVDYAIAHGVNYFDTAAPYHGSRSELAIGKALSRYPRESFNLADKFPGHQVVKGSDPAFAATFDGQLKKCQVDYFDFYLMHNVSEHSSPFYMDKKIGCVDYFVEQKKLGRIKHLGFSCHGDVDNLKAFLDEYGDVMEFCQIQLNYLDWSLQAAEKKCALLKERGIPIWVMEPVRGGRLAKLDEESEKKLRALRPDESTAAWGFRWLQTVPKVTMVLSGMSNLEQMKDNVKTFDVEKPLNNEETALLYSIASGLKALIPCTGCRYCCAGCPMELNIPMLMSLCNETRVGENINTTIRYDSLGEKNAAACIGCGQCSAACPQKIDVPAAMTELAENRAGKKTWAEICEERNRAQASTKL